MKKGTLLYGAYEFWKVLKVKKKNVILSNGSLRWKVGFGVISDFKILKVGWRNG